MMTLVLVNSRYGKSIRNTQVSVPLIKFCIPFANFESRILNKETLFAVILIDTNARSIRRVPSSDLLLPIWAVLKITILAGILFLVFQRDRRFESWENETAAKSLLCNLNQSLGYEMFR